MARPKPITDPFHDSWQTHEEAICRFEREWRHGETPDIAAFLGDLSRGERLYRRTELVKVDLEYRWQTRAPATVEEYVAQFPELAIEQTILDELIREEFASRGVALKLPGEDEVRQRFPETSEKWLAIIETVRKQSRSRSSSERSESSAEVQSPTGQAVMQPDVRIGDRYIVHERLGKGAFASVWRATDCELDRDVAIKILHAEMSFESSATMRMVREARAVAILDHPAIVPVFEVGEWQERPFIVSQFIAGMTLEEKLRSDTVSLEWAAATVRDVARGLHHAHEHGVVHRDVKPANILLTKDERPLLADFGLAHHLEQAGTTITREGDLIGTPAYMAPEQAGGQHQLVDARVDVYALGVVLYEATTGRLPFSGSTTTIVHKIMFDAPPLPRKTNAQIGRDLETIILRSLEKEPADRYVSAAALAEDLERMLSGEPIHARVVGHLERLWKWSRRRPRMAALLAAVLVPKQA